MDKGTSSLKFLRFGSKKIVHYEALGKVHYEFNKN